MTFFFLLKVTKVLMHRTQIIVTIGHMDMFRSEFFSDEWSVHDHDILLPAAGHQGHGAQR